MENLPVNIQLNVGQINRLLSLLGTHPYNTSADLIHLIKSQGDAQMDAARAQAAIAAAPNGEDAQAH
jgi:hypothetical protein